MVGSIEAIKSLSDYCGIDSISVHVLSILSKLNKKIGAGAAN